MPPVINYAGQVTVGGEAFDGEGFFKFAIVNDSGSITYWSNDGKARQDPNQLDPSAFQLMVVYTQFF